jgi:S-methylmethionine-dependent homocysteine/selenocysteine methylase
MLLAQAIQAGPVLLDGGLATWLEAAGQDLRDDLWSARLLAEDPAAIVAAHGDFLRAGARVLTTASYQATVAGFVRRGFDTARANDLIRSSVDLARTAAHAAVADGTVKGPLWIAASIGPYGAALGDGSEYRGDYGVSHAELVRFHRPRIELLAQAQPDVLALETVPDIREAEALLSVLAEFDIPAWLSYTIDGARTRAGQPIVSAFALAAGVSSVLAVGVNCSSPVDATAAVPVAAQVSGKPVVVYPNSGERWNAERRRWVGEPIDLATLAPQWVADGARIVGGCCRVSPSDIARFCLAVP